MRPRRRGPPVRQEVRVPRRPITSPQLNPSKTQDAVKTYVMRYVLGNTLIGNSGTKYAPMQNLVSATVRAHRMMNDSPKGAQDPSVNKDKQQASGEAGTSSSPASIPRGPKATKRKAHQARRIKVDEAERSRASHALTVSQRQAQCIAGRPPSIFETVRTTRSEYRIAFRKQCAKSRDRDRQHAGRSTHTPHP